jgi:hypothetical protein
MELSSRPAVCQRGPEHACVGIIRHRHQRLHMLLAGLLLEVEAALAPVQVAAPANDAHDGSARDEDAKDDTSPVACMAGHTWRVYVTCRAYMSCWRVSRSLMPDDDQCQELQHPMSRPKRHACILHRAALLHRAACWSLLPLLSSRCYIAPRPCLLAPHATCCCLPAAASSFLLNPCFCLRPPSRLPHKSQASRAPQAGALRSPAAYDCVCISTASVWLLYALNTNTHLCLLLSSPQEVVSALAFLSLAVPSNTWHVLPGLLALHACRRAAGHAVRTQALLATTCQLMRT